MITHRLEVLPEMLSRKCDPDSLGFETTEELAPLEGLIGQDRAFSALELALSIEEPGFNLFISGPSGTGRNTALMSHVQQMTTLKNVPPDWGYVYNFQDPSQPEPISLPCGHMRVLAADMNELSIRCGETFRRSSRATTTRSGWRPLCNAFRRDAKR